MERISVVTNAADVALAASAASVGSSFVVAADTVVKMSLESFCKTITLGKGKRQKLLLTKLREQALQMNDVVTETWHLIQLYCHDYFEKAAASANHGLDMPKWDETRVMEFLRVVTTCTQPSTKTQCRYIKKFDKNYTTPLRANIPLVSRAGLPSNALEEACTRMAAAINTNIKNTSVQAPVAVHCATRQLVGQESCKRKAAANQCCCSCWIDC